VALTLGSLILAAGCSIGAKSAKHNGKSYVIKGKRYYLLATADGYREKGLASWYGEPFHGRKTASGEIFNMYEFSAAHKTLPLQTWVEVKNVLTNQKMYLRINDRGPFIDGRIIDLSRAAAIELGILRAGVAPVVVTAIPTAKAKKLAAQQKNTKKTSWLRNKSSPFNN
jgi:rare lipoprotein A